MRLSGRSANGARVSVPWRSRMRRAVSRVSGSRPRRSRHGPTLSTSRQTAAAPAAPSSGCAITPCACARSAKSAPRPTIAPTTKRRLVVGSPYAGKARAETASSSARPSSTRAEDECPRPRSSARATRPGWSRPRGPGAVRARGRARAPRGRGRRPCRTRRRRSRSRASDADERGSAGDADRDAAAEPSSGDRGRSEAQLAPVEQLAAHATLASSGRGSSATTCGSGVAQGAASTCRTARGAATSVPSTAAAAARYGHASASELPQ